MFIEIKKAGKKKKYYLAYSFREGKKIKKIRIYLGANLSEEKIRELKKRTEPLILEKIRIYKSIKNPLKYLLSEKEIRELNKLLNLKIRKIKIIHLSEKEWLKFSELFSYDTNAIEGSTITKREVKQIIEEDKWPEDISKMDISETYGVVEAINHIRKTRVHLSLDLIKELHRIVFRNSKSFAGKFRSKGIEVIIRNRLGNIVHRGAPSTKIIQLLKELIRWYNKNKNRYHPFLLAVIVHNQFETIHPFQDGNGRVGRLLLNNVLIKNKMPPVNIELKKRTEYYSALQEYQNNGNLRPMIDLILKEYKILRKQFV